jgi:hypothetical protein
MNNDSDNIRNLLLWLLQNCDPTFSSPSGNGPTLEAKLEADAQADAPKASTLEVGSDATSMKPLYPQGFEESSSDLSTFSSAARYGASTPGFSSASREASVTDALSQTAQSFNFGEIHAVQERFEALLKQRLLSEYENRPPLFPWESEVSEYPVEVADLTATAAISAFWSTHVSALEVPGLLPHALLDSLFERCQVIARSPIKQGVRLVRAVEALFPDQAELLEPIANMVLVPAYRSDSATQLAVTQELANVAGGYDSARPEQQIALSMLAAQEILGALTFSISAERPQETKSWVTPRGALELTVSYRLGQLTLVATLPAGGDVRLRDGEVEKQAMRSQPGTLDIIWTDSAPDKTYVLEISLIGEPNPLNFVIHIADELS